MEDHELKALPEAQSEESSSPSRRFVEATIGVALLAMVVAGIAAAVRSQAQGVSPEGMAIAVVGAVIAVNIFPIITIAILAIFPSKRRGKLFAQVYLGWSICLVVLNALELLQVLGGRHS